MGYQSAALTIGSSSLFTCPQTMSQKCVFGPDSVYIVKVIVVFGTKFVNFTLSVSYVVLWRAWSAT